MKIAAYKVGLLLIVLGIMAMVIHGLVHHAVLDLDTLVLGFLPIFVGLVFVLLDLLHHLKR